MKFTVTHGPLNEVDVRLAYETKTKLMKSAWYTFVAATAVGAVALQIHIRKNPEMYQAAVED